MSAQMHHTPLDLARQHGHGTVIEILESKAMKKVSDYCVSVHAHTMYMYVTCNLIVVRVLYVLAYMYLVDIILS